jgi:hypothetical protein
MAVTKMLAYSAPMAEGDHQVADADCAVWLFPLIATAAE